MQRSLFRGNGVRAFKMAAIEDRLTTDILHWHPHPHTNTPTKTHTHTHMHTRTCAHTPLHTQVSTSVLFLLLYNGRCRVCLCKTIHAECHLCRDSCYKCMVQWELQTANVAVKVGCILFAYVAVSPYWGSSVQCTHESLNTSMPCFLCHGTCIAPVPDEARDKWNIALDYWMIVGMSDHLKKNLYNSKC